MQKGLDVVQPGDTLTLLAGIYPAGGISKRAGTASARITIVGAGTPVSKGKGQLATVKGMLTISHSYYTVRNIHFEGFKLFFASGAVVYNIAEYNWINGAAGGLRLSQASNGVAGLPSYCIARDNIVTYWTTNAAVNVCGHDNTITSNRFEHSNGWDATRCFGYNHLIQDNIFNDISVDTVTGNHCDIIQSFGTNGSVAHDIIFERNTITNSSGQLCNLEQDGVADQRDWTFRNNLTINSRIQANINIPGTKWYNNTFYNSPWAIAINVGNSATKGRADNTRVCNNIFFGCGTTSSNGFYNYGPNLGLTGCVYDYNFMANADGSPKTIYKAEPHGINGGNPKFVNISTNDFHLATGSCAIGRGVLESGYTTDLALQPRITPWDLGCLNHGSTLYPPTNLVIVP